MPRAFPVMGHVMGHPQCSACPCTWRSTAQTPHRAFIAATHRGTAPAQALTSAGSIGCSRQAGPPALYQHASPKTGTGIQRQVFERLLWTLGSRPRVTIWFVARSEEHTSEIPSLMRILFTVL